METRQFVVVIARHAETLDGLHAYLEKLGVPSSGARTLDALARTSTNGRTAIVVFPDDFPEAEVLAALAALHRHRHRVRTVVVTRSPERFRSASVDVVLPRPAFGWDILDAVLGRTPRGAMD